MSAGLTSNQSISSGGANTLLTLSSMFDPQGWWDAENYWFKPTIAGYYYITGQVFWANGGASANQYNIQLNDQTGAQITITQQLTNQSAFGQTMHFSRTLYFNGLRYGVIKDNRGLITCTSTLADIS
jgi:hypothetical protein